MNTGIEITKFTGVFRFLSNFHPAPVMLDGIVFPTVEHAYQAAKTKDKNWRERIQECSTPGAAKRLGRKLRVRHDWDKIKLQVMEDLVRQKFTKHPHLKQGLLQTDQATLVEDNTWGDFYWGVCQGRGINHLGLILMKVRGELR